LEMVSMQQFLMETKDTLSFTMVSNLRNCVELNLLHESISMTIGKVNQLRNFHWIKIAHL